MTSLRLRAATPFVMRACVVLAIALFAVPAVSAAAEYIPWTELGGQNERDHFETTPYANPDPPVFLAQVDDAIYGSSSTPLAVNIDSDPELEVVIASDFWEDWYLTFVTAYDWNGAGLTMKWQTTLPVGISATTQVVRLAAADFDGDGASEIVAFQNGKNDGGATSTAGTMYINVLNGANGVSMAGISYGGFDEQGGMSHPSVGDVDGDGQLEIVTADYNSLDAFRFTGSTIVQEWTWAKASAVGAEFALGEVDSNHNGLEIIHSSDSSGTAGTLYTCRPSAAAANCVAGTTYGAGPFGVALRDMDGDGQLEAATGSRSTAGASEMIVWAHDGTGKFSFKAGTSAGYLWNAPAIGDVNLDGNMDFVNAFDHNYPDLPDNHGHVYAAEYNAGAVSSLGQVTRTAVAGLDDFRVNYGGALANIVGDEKLEYVHTDKWGDLRIIEFDASGVPSLKSTEPSDWFASSPVAVADINGDCALDIIYTNEGGQLWVLGDKTPRYVPDAVTTLSGTENGTAATLTWNAPAYDGDRPVIEYKIYRGPRGGTLDLIDTIEANGTPMSYIDNGTKPGPGNAFAAEVDYQVVAVNCMGDSPVSNKIELDVHEPPFVVNNVKQMIEVGDIIDIDAVAFQFDDDLSSHENITYTFVTVTTEGDLYFTPAGGSATQVAAGDTLSQLDIDNGLLSYTSTGTADYADTFDVNVTDHHGKWAPIETFEIEAILVGEFMLVNAEGITLREFSTLGLPNGNLKARDPAAGPADLTFTVTSEPLYGFLELDGMSLAFEDTFTQQDIDDGLLSFVANGGSGTTSFTFTVANDSGGMLQGTIPITVTPAKGPTAGFGTSPQPFLTGQPVTFFDGSVVGDAPISTYEWYVDGELVSTDSFYGAIFKTAGDREIKLVITDEFGNSAEATSVYAVQLYTPPDASFYTDKAYARVGDLVTFWDQTEAGSLRIVMREWDFKDGVEANVELQDQLVIDHKFSRAGEFLVALTVTDELGFRDIATHNLIIIDRDASEEEAKAAADKSKNSGDDMTIIPIADAGPDQVVVQGTVARLDGSFSTSPLGRDLTYQWTYVDGMMLDLKDPTVAKPTFSVPWLQEDERETIFQLIVSDGEFTSEPDLVRLVVRQEGSPSLPVVPAPTAQFKFDSIAGGKVSFQSLDKNLDGAQYFWDFGDGTTSTKAAPTHRYADAGAYSVKLTVRDEYGRETTLTKGIVYGADGQVVSPEANEFNGAADSKQSSGTPTWMLVATGVLAMAVLSAGGFLVYTFATRKK